MTMYTEHSLFWTMRRPSENAFLVRYVPLTALCPWKKWHDRRTSDPLHCKDKIPKFRNKYSQKRNIGVSVPISTFMRLWAIYIFPQSVCLFCWRKYVDRSWDYMNRSQTHECGNWGWGRAIPRKGIHSGIFVAVYAPCVRTIAAWDATFGAGYAVPSLHTFSVVSPFFIYLFIVVRNIELIRDRTHQDASSKGRIVQWVYRPRDEASDGRMVQTIMDKTSVGDELKLHQSQGRLLIIKVFSFVHKQYNTEWPISHVFVFM